MTPPALLELARDPLLIKGIHDVCDQWCMYCTVTSRCLAFRCNPEVPMRHGHVRGDPDADLIDGLMVVQTMADAEGRPAPIEVDAFLSDDRRKKTYLYTLDDPLERMGASYMKLSDAYLRSRQDLPLDVSRRASAPTPLEVFAWFHDLVPARIFRAVLSAGAERAGLGKRHNDALGAAKLALVGIDRSLEALGAMAADDDDPRLRLMMIELRALRHALDSRFPEARRFVRPGLDAPPSEA